MLGVSGEGQGILEEKAIAIREYKGYYVELFILAVVMDKCTCTMGKIL